MVYTHPACWITKQFSIGLIRVATRRLVRVVKSEMKLKSSIVGRKFNPWQPFMRIPCSSSRRFYLRWLYNTPEGLGILFIFFLALILSFFPVVLSSKLTHLGEITAMQVFVVYFCKVVSLRRPISQDWRAAPVAKVMSCLSYLIMKDVSI